MDRPPCPIPHTDSTDFGKRDAATSALISVVRDRFTVAAEAAFADASMIHGIDGLAAYLAGYERVVVDVSMRGRLELASIAGRFVAAAAVIDARASTAPARLRRAIETASASATRHGWNLAHGRLAVDDTVLDGLVVEVHEYMPLNAGMLLRNAEKLLHAAVSPEVDPQDVLRVRPPLSETMRSVVLPAAGASSAPDDAALRSLGLIVEGLTPQWPRTVDGCADEPGGRSRTALCASVSAPLWLLLENPIGSASQFRQPGALASQGEALAGPAELIVSVAAMLLTASGGRAALFDAAEVAVHLKRATAFLSHALADRFRPERSPRDRQALMECGARSLIWLTCVEPEIVEAGLKQACPHSP